MTRKIPKRVTRADQLVVGDVIRFTYKNNAFKRGAENRNGRRRFYWTPRDPDLGENAGLINGAAFEAVVRSVHDGRVHTSPRSDNYIGKGGNERSILSLSFTMDMVTDVRIKKPAREMYSEHIGPLFFEYTYGDTFFNVFEYRHSLGPSAPKSGAHKVTLPVARKIAKALREIVDWKEPKSKPPKPPKVKRGIIPVEALRERDVVDIEFYSLEEVSKLSDEAKQKIGERPFVLKLALMEGKVSDAEVSFVTSTYESVTIYAKDQKVTIPWAAIKKVKRKRRLPPKVARKQASPPSFTTDLKFRRHTAHTLSVRPDSNLKPVASVGCKVFHSPDCIKLLEWLEWFIAWAEQSLAEKKAKRKAKKK